MKNRLKTIIVTGLLITCSIPLQAMSLLDMNFNGDLLDMSTNLHHASSSDKVLFKEDGYRGKSLHVDSMNANEIVIEHSAILSGMKNLDISIWAKKSDEDSHGYLFNKELHYSLLLEDDATISATLTNEKSQTLSLRHTNYYPLLDLQWHQYELKYDGEIAQLLVDGLIVSQQPFHGKINSDANYDLHIVSNSDHGNFSGDIDEFSVNSADVLDDIVMTPHYSKVVELNMDGKNFKWMFDKKVKWGYFIDGQPWVIRPKSGIKLVSISPRKEQKHVPFSGYIHGKKVENQMVLSTINQSVINPPASMLSAVQVSGIRTFGWDSRGEFGRELGTSYNSHLGWDAKVKEMSVGDSIVSAYSYTKNPQADAKSCLDVLAVLTVLAEVPPMDAFRPGSIREGRFRTNPEILQYSSIIRNINSYLISDTLPPLLEQMDSVLKEHSNEVVGELNAKEFEYLLTQPWFVKSMDMAYLHVSNTDDIEAQHQLTYNKEIVSLAVASFSKYVSAEMRNASRVRLMQYGIDIFHAIESGLILDEFDVNTKISEELLSVVGTFLDHEKMLNIDTMHKVSTVIEGYNEVFQVSNLYVDKWIDIEKNSFSIEYATRNKIGNFDLKFKKEIKASEKVYISTFVNMKR